MCNLCNFNSECNLNCFGILNPYPRPVHNLTETINLAIGSIFFLRICLNYSKHPFTALEILHITIFLINIKKSLHIFCKNTFCQGWVLSSLWWSLAKKQTLLRGHVLSCFLALSRECVLVPNVSGCLDSNCPDRTLLLSVKLPSDDILNRMCFMSMLQFPQLGIRFCS